MYHPKQTIEGKQHTKHTYFLSEHPCASKKRALGSTWWLSVLILSLSLLLMLSSCEQQLVQQGVIKNINTGMTSRYHGLHLDGAIIMMHGKEVKHKNIPIGEEFQLINSGIKNLHEKNNIVQLGCSLQISDVHGNMLLDESDLYQNHDQFHKDSITFLRCLVSTGAPMKVNEEYVVDVLFWDKQGEGRIENSMRIRCTEAL